MPCYSLTAELLDMAIENALTYRNQVDELIICEDGGRISGNLANMSNIYAYFNENKGFTANVNRGLKLATGDFVIVASSDTQLAAGNIRDLCVDGKITSPKNEQTDELWGACFCVPKEILESRGLLNETMKTYYSDEEYKERTKDIFQTVDSVKVLHEQQQTVKVAGVEGKMDDDKKAYENLVK